MKPLNIIVLLLFLPFALLATGGDKSSKNNKTTEGYINNRPPLKPKAYMELPLGAIRAKGWLKEQLVRQKNGLSGELDKYYPLMNERNGWLGGDGDQWERGPYWIDGLLPLAYILDDAELKAKVKPWIEWALNSQRLDGYFGPSTPETPYVPEPGVQKENAEDWWPKMVMLKILAQHHSATGDQRVIELMTNYFKYQLKVLPEKPLGHWTFWAQRRGGDNLMYVYWLYNITGDKFLLELAELIHQQTFDWTEVLTNGDMLRDKFQLHCVNMVQGLKEPIIYYQQHPEQKYIDAVKIGLETMREHNGQPQGLFGGDEWLHGKNPTQGSELCTAMEMMFSMENMLAITGDVQFADHLEKVAFNAVPTQTTDDFMTRQYFHQPNQVMVSRSHRNFITPFYGTEQTFGLVTGYPCCTANMHQGWPKFTQNLWYATPDSGVAALIYAPSEVNVQVANGVDVKIVEETYYPFDETINFTFQLPKEVKSAKFPFHLRVPEWCEKAKIMINGKEFQEAEAKQIVKVDREWKSGDVVQLILPMKVRTSEWYLKSVAVERGPLVYALKIGEDWKKVENNDEYGDYYEVYPTTPWNYGLLQVEPEQLQEAFKVIKKGHRSDFPWNLENAPIEIKAKAKRLPDWKLYNGMAGPLPSSPQWMNIEDADIEEITLIPYGCTTLRISEFPMVTPRPW